MQVDSPFHFAFSIRIPSRDAAVALFRTDSKMTPVMTASFGMTMPWNVVATASFPCTVVPTGVLPASTLCCKVTGNSRKTEEEAGVEGEEEEEGAGGCWPAQVRQQSPRTTP